MTVRVMGYTDSDPIVKTKNLWKDNLDLSANRAMEVTRHLWSKGISAEHIETVAMGATHFMGPNTTKAGKAGNRRVEISVVKR
jgi:chemotaxis protein MotB